VNGPAFVLAVVVAMLVVLGGYVLLATYNDVVGLLQRIGKAWANIDVALKQRHDELPNLVNAVRGLMGFEQAVLERVAQARAAYAREAPIPAQAVVSEATTAALRSLFAVVEAYPDIKAHANVLELQAEIQRLEGIIADRRELYNDMVYRYNTRIRTLPTLLLTPLLGWQPRPFFKATEAEAARPDVAITPG
jgi:LemA protein